MLEIKEVNRDSIADKNGIAMGDSILSINGHRIRDAIDLAFYESDEKLNIRLRRDGKIIGKNIEKLAEEKLGINLEPFSFRRCSNECIFCFYDQMPQGLRRNLYTKDDDYRLSFLYGNYITLTNMVREDFDRISEQRLSPLYVSVHSTDAKIRAKMLGVDSSRADIMKPLARLAREGIEIHSQIVVCPGMNDEDSLERTVNDLAQFYPSVRSIAVIPVGLTKYRKHLFHLNEITIEQCLKIIEKSLIWQEKYRKAFGIGFVYPSDEVFIKGEFGIPVKGFYDGFPQFENGVGISRIFLDEIEEIEMEEFSNLNGSIAFITGMLAFPWVNLLRKRLILESSLRVDIIPVKNNFFGELVTVSGLLTGGDILEAIKAYRKEVNFFVIPDNCLNEDGLFLDNLSLSDISRQSATKVIVSPLSIRRLLEGMKRKCAE